MRIARFFRSLRGGRAARPHLAEPAPQPISLAPAPDATPQELARENEGLRLYYEHQYRRMEAIEDQAFKMSGGVFLLTAAVFSFLSGNSHQSSQPLLSWKLVLSLMCFANSAAVIYLWRVHTAICVHARRAKALLQLAWPRLWEIDRRYPLRFASRLQIRPLIHLLLHLVLTASGAWVLWQAHLQALAAAHAH